MAAVAVIVLTAATLWVVNAYARRSPVVACRFGPGVTLYSSLDRLPELLTAYLAGKLANPAGLGTWRVGAARWLLHGYFMVTSMPPIS